MIKRKHKDYHKETEHKDYDQKEIEHKDYQWSKGNRTQRLSMIKKDKDYQWSKGNTQRLSMIKRKQNTKTINDQKET